MMPRQATNRPVVTHAELRRIMEYRPETGDFVWLITRGKVKPGRRAGIPRDDGYVRIEIDRRRYYGHRLAVFWMTGEWPKEHVDHINRNTSDNRWCNLRLASQPQNLYNMTAHKDNFSGLKGVGWDKSRGKWQSHICVDRKITFLGRFDCPAAAHFAYVIAAQRLHGEFARAR